VIKPASSTLPRWASTVSADPARVVEPPSGKKDVGWDVAEKPPAQWKNWLSLQVYTWLLWLDSFESEPHTWSRTQTLTEGIAVSNTTLNTRAILATGNGTAEGAKCVGGSTGGHGCIGEGTGAGTYGVFGRGLVAGVTGIRGEGGSGSPGGSFFGGAGGIGLQATGGTGNAAGLAGQGSGSGVGVTGVGGVTGDGGDFRGGTTSGTGCTVTGGGSSGIGLLATGGGPNGNAIEAVAPGSGLALKATGAISTNDSVYADVVLRAGTSSTCTVRSNRVEFDGVTHPASNASIKHQVRPVNTPRVWATIVTDGAGNVSVLDGSGVASVAISGTAIVVTFVDAFLDNKYAVLVSGYDGSVPTGTPKFGVYRPNNTTTTAEIACVSDPATVVLNLFLLVLGRQ